MVPELRVETLFSATHSSVFNTKQNAIQAILELLGTTVQPIPVIMPVTASLQTLTAVLRAGGVPNLVDISEKTLQFDPGVLKEVLEDLKVGLVLLNRVSGCLDPELKDVLKDWVTICDTDIAPYQKMDGVDLWPTFNVFTFDQYVQTGALVLHADVDNVRKLIKVRSGTFGMNADMPSLVASRLYEIVKNHEASVLAAHRETAPKLKEKLEAAGFTVLPHSQWCSPLWVRVEDPFMVHEFVTGVLPGVKMDIGAYSLADCAAVKPRFEASNPHFPVAEKVLKYVLLSTTSPRLVDDLVKYMIEATE